MFKILNLILLLTTLSFSQIKLFVSVQGDDNWSGRTASYTGTTAQNGTFNGPYRSVERAIDEFTRLDSTNYWNSGRRDSLKRNVEIQIRAGIYYISKTLWIRNTNQGEENPLPKLKITAFNNENVILSGATPIYNYSNIGDENILNRLDASVRDKVYVANINFANVGEDDITSIENRFDITIKNYQMNLSRYPKTDFLEINNVIDLSSEEHILRIKNDSRFAEWKIPENIFVTGYWSRQYYTSFQPLRTIEFNDSADVSILGNPVSYGYSSGGTVYKEGISYNYYPPFYFTNILEEVNKPNDYYVDNVNKLLYFYPPDESQVPRITTLNTMFFLNACNGITISNITIQDCGEGIRINGGGANFNRKDGFIIKNCIIRNIKSTAIYVNDAYNVLINNNEIYNCNAMGIMVNWCGVRHYVDEIINSNVKITNNKIHDFAKIFIRDNEKDLAMSGIRVEKSVAVNISGNEIYNSRTIGIYMTGNDNIIENNNFYNLCYETLSLGAVYTWGDLTSQGNVVRNNYFHDIVSMFRTKYPLEEYRSIGIHLDGFSSGWQLTNNIFKNCGTGILYEGGSANSATNNIFYKCKYAIRTYEARTWQYPDNISSIYADAERVNYTSVYWIRKYPYLNILLEDTSFAMKYNSFQNNIVAKCYISRHNVTEAVTVRTEDEILGADNNYTSNTEIPFSEDNMTFKLNSYLSKVSKSGFKEIPFNSKWIK